MIFTFFLLLLLIIHIYLQQSDKHSKQDTQKLQICTSFSHLATDKKKSMCIISCIFMQIHIHGNTVDGPIGEAAIVFCYLWGSTE